MPATATPPDSAGAELHWRALESLYASAPVNRLFEGAVSGNLGPIDSPAYRFHGLPLPHQWQWHGEVGLGPVTDGENVYVRLRQANGQMAWTSPIFCRRNFEK